jgi:DNA polymerase I
MLYLVDASVFIFRAWFSVPAEVTDRDGNPVNAVLGFARFLGELLEKESPRHIAVAFDESLEQGFRNEIYPAYKANREPAPVELKRQFALCREVCSALGVPQYGSSRYEADDIIGTLAIRARAAGLPVTIVSRDKDLTQLLSSVDTYWDAVADVRYGYHDIAERFGVVPERMADFLALMGDAVDNIPGVPGVGRKTAQTLLKHFDTLDGVLDNIDQIARLKFRDLRRGEPARAPIYGRAVAPADRHRLRHAAAGQPHERAAAAATGPRDARYLLRGAGFRAAAA